MLESLHEIGWAKLSHAYGKATDVPDLLRGLGSTSPKKRDAAIGQLAASICHQGTLFSATPAAIPFLVELLGAPKVRDKASILRLLADIATLDDESQFLLDGVPSALTGELPAVFRRSLVSVAASWEVIRIALDELHSDGSDVRRILGHVPPERREALVKDLYFNLYAGPSSERKAAVYFRVAWHFCDLVPTAEFAERAAASLVGGPLLSGHDCDGSESLGPELVSSLVTRFAPFGVAGRAALERVIPRASTETAAFIASVLAQLAK